MRPDHPNEEDMKEWVHAESLPDILSALLDEHGLSNFMYHVTVVVAEIDSGLADAIGRFQV